MNTHNPRLEASLVRTAHKEVRHLVIDYVDGARETKLVQLSDGVETPIATGTEYEMRQNAEALVRRWVTDEGFKRQSPAFESLAGVVALATKLGFTTVYDASVQGLPNLTGEVPLGSWPGMTPKNGGGYVYALDHSYLLAQPTLPVGQGFGVPPSDPKELALFAKKASERLELVGSFRQLLLG